MREADPVEALPVLARTSRHAPFAERIEAAAKWLSEGTLPRPQQVAAELGNRTEATKSCMTSVFIASIFAQRPFEEMLDFVSQCGGDVDTIGAMAGALWGARRGRQELPAHLIA